MRTFKLDENIKVNPVTNIIVKDGIEKRVSHRSMSVLVCLAKRKGEVVSRNELTEEVWEGLVVSQDSVARAVSELRKALGDSAKEPKYVQTLTGKGLRLLCSVTWTETKKRQAHNLPTHSSTRFTFPFVIAAIVVAVILSVTLFSWEDEQNSVWESYPLFASDDDERFPRFSKSGRYVLSTRINNTHGYTIVLYDVIEKKEVQVVGPTTDILSNGGFLSNDEEILYTRHTSRSCHLYLLNLITSQTEKLDNCSPISSVSTGDISKNKQRMAIYQNSDSPEVSIVVKDRRATSPSSDFVISGAQQALLYPRFSSDSNHLAYVRKSFDKDTDIVEVLDLNNKNILLSKEFQRHSISQVAWMNDEALAVSSISPMRSGIYQVHLDDNSPQLLISGRFPDMDYSARTNVFAVSEQELIVAFKRVDLKITPMKPEIYESIPSPFVVQYVVSDNGQSRAYTERRYDKHLLILESANKGKRRLYQDTAAIEKLRFSPNAQMVAFTKVTPRGKELWSADEEETKILVNGVDDFAWLTNSTILYSSSEDNQSYIFQIDTGDQMIANSFPVGPVHQWESVDGAVYFQQHHGSAVKSFDVNHPDIVQVVTTDYVREWSVGNQYLAYVTPNAEKNNAMISLINTESGTKEVIESLPYTGLWQFQIAFENDSLIYSYPTSRNKGGIKLFRPAQN